MFDNFTDTSRTYLIIFVDPRTPLLIFITLLRYGYYSVKRFWYLTEI